MKGKAWVLMAIGVAFVGGCAGPVPDKSPSSEPVPKSSPAHPSDKRQNSRIAVVPCSTGTRKPDHRAGVQATL